MNHRLFTSPTVIILLVALALLLLNSSAQGVQFNQAPPAPVAEPSPTALVSGLDADSTTEEKIIAAPAACTGLTCTILATAGWQQTPLTLQQGSPFRILYTSGSWTVDHRSFPYVGPDGYAPAVDSQITPGCKVDTMLPYAHLLGQIGSGPIFSIGMGGAFTANASGVLSLRINDADSCLEDNDGALVLQTQTEFSCANVTEIPTSECNALVALYNSTNGPNWTNRSGWLTTIMPCSWFGVSCLNGHVYLLALLDNQLRGPLPTQLGDFPDMLAIYMSGNQLSGNIPTQLGNLTKLLDLDLGNNQLSGSIPAQLGNLPNLIHLYLNVNQLNGSIPTQLGNRTSLITLNLCCNQLSGNIPPQLGNLTGLGELTLSANYLNGSIPTQLGNLTNLTSLGLCCNQLSGNIPTQLGNLTKLTFLSLDGNQLSGSLPTQLGNLVNLTALHLENNQSLNGALPGSLTNLTKLATFWFHNTSLCEPGDSAFQNWLASIANLNRTGVCPANITVQFGAAAYTVNENGQVGGFQEVILSAASSQPVTVQFATSNGTATAGSDYTATNATLTFNPGETSKSFTVPILEDTLDESDETINLTLSNPTNAILGTPANATLTIVDNDVCYTLITSVNPSGAGSVATNPAPNCQGNQYTQGTVVALAATANAGFAFSSWGGAVNGATNPVNVTMDGNKQVTANFNSVPGNRLPVANNQNVTTAQNTAVNIMLIASDADNDPLIYIIVSNPSHGGLSGTPPNLIYTPNPGFNGSDSFTFKANDGKADSNIATVSINVTAPTTPCYTLTTGVNPSNGGTLATAPSPNCPGNKYLQGTVVSLSATANPIYEFNQWSGDANNNANPLNVTMDRNKSITANFREKPFSCSNVTEIPQIECEALVALYNSTAGTAWTNHSSWLVTLTPCSWFGVTCSNSHVAALNLDGNRLTGTIPVQLGNLANLATLDLSINSLSGMIPPQLGNLNTLSSLILGENFLTGNIPPELGRLANLVELSLDDNVLTGSIPPALGSLTHLQTLDLFSNELSGTIPTQIGNLTNLTYLRLSYNQLSGGIPAEIGNLINLTTLSLDDNLFSGSLPTQLGNLVNLTSLRLENTSLSGALPGTLVSLSKLTTFWFNNTSLCEPGDSAFQSWLAKILFLKRTGIICVTADFTASPLNGNAPLIVSFHNSSIGSFTNCAWDYGDGTTGNLCDPDHSHTYNAAGTYTVQLTVSSPGGADTKTRTDYIIVALRPTYSISGRVTDNRGSPIAGVNITIETGRSATTNSDGRYNLDGVFAGSYLLTPSKGDNTFSPSLRSISITGSITGQDFTINCEKSPTTGLDSCNLEAGDILLVRGAGGNILDGAWWIKNAGSYFHHAAIYVGNQEVTEAVGIKLLNRKDEVITHSVKDSIWWDAQEDIEDWVVLRPISPQNKAVPTHHAKKWADAEDPVIGYNLFSSKDDDTSFYCSKLAWRAYDLVGVNLQVSRTEAWGISVPDSIVTPFDLYNANSVQVQSDASQVGKRPAIVVIARSAQVLYSGIQSQFALLSEPITTTSPAHLMLVDLQGRRTGYDPTTGSIVNEIPGAIYSGTDALYENVSVTDFDGQWQVIVTGVDTSDYRLVAEFLDATDPQRQFVEDSTVPGQIDQYTISAPSIAIYLPLISR